MLRKLGWDVETAYQARLAVKTLDVNLLIYARGHDRIYVTFDDLAGEEGERVGRELRKNGGNIIQIHGGADQDKYRIVGKLLFHYPEWYPFQVKCDGDYAKGRHHLTNFNLLRSGGKVNMMKADRKKKRPSAEKTISLKPLKFDEAVSDLLKVKPEEKKVKSPTEKPNTE